MRHEQRRPREDVTVASNSAAAVTVVRLLGDHALLANELLAAAARAAAAPGCPRVETREELPCVADHADASALADLAHRAHRPPAINAMLALALAALVGDWWLLLVGVTPARLHR